MCVLIIVATALSFLLAFLVTRPLVALSNELKKVSRLELELCNLHASNFLEVKQMHESFFMMHAALSSFKRYVPVGIISKILETQVLYTRLLKGFNSTLVQTEAKLGLQNADVTVLFLDIEGFTKLSETMPNHQLASLTAEFLQAMSDIIIKNGGTIDKYIGDAVMAIFNVPEKLLNHPTAACEAALECVQALNQLNPKWRKTHNVELRFRIGINCGEVLD